MEYIAHAYLPFSYVPFFPCPSALFCNSLAPPVDLRLTIVITFGVDQILTYTFTENCLSSLTITNAQADGTQMRMKHTEAKAYIPYAMTFDYGDGMQRSQEMLGFSHGEYDVTGSFYITEASDEYLREIIPMR